MNLNIRWMIQSDIAQILAFENNSLTSDKIYKKTKQKNILPWSVVDNNNHVVAYAFVKLFKDHYKVTHLVVKPHYQRRKIGTQIIHKMIKNLCPGKRLFFLIRTLETNYMAINFLSKMGLIATGIEKGHQEDYILWRYHLGCNISNPVNRMNNKNASV